MGEFMGEKRDYITLEVIHHNAYEQQPTEEPETPAPSISHIRAEARTKKSAATRKRIMHETTKLMLARGNTNFKMSEISDRARLSKGALYYYFSDREALLQAIFDESVDELAKDIAHTIGNKPASKETLHAIIAQLAAHILPDSPLVLALINKLVSSEQALITNIEGPLSRVVVLLANQLEMGKLQGFIRQSVDSRLAACSITGALVLSAIGLMGERHGAEGSDELAQNLLDMTLAGIGIDE